MLPHSLYQTSFWICGDSLVSMPARVQQVAQRLHARRGLARRLADDQPVAEVMPHHARRVERAAGMHHAADHVRGREWPRRSRRPGRPPPAACRRARRRSRLAGTTTARRSWRSARWCRARAAARSARPRRPAPAPSRRRPPGPARRARPGRPWRCTGTRVRTSPRISDRPSRCSASSVAPRATTLMRAAGLRQRHADPAADGAGAVDADFHDSVGSVLVAWRRCGRPGAPARRTHPARRRGSG